MSKKKDHYLTREYISPFCWRIKPEEETFELLQLYTDSKGVSDTGLKLLHPSLRAFVIARRSYLPDWSLDPRVELVYFERALRLELLPKGDARIPGGIREWGDEDLQYTFATTLTEHLMPQGPSFPQEIRQVLYDEIYDQMYDAACRRLAQQVFGVTRDTTASEISKRAKHAANVFLWAGESIWMQISNFALNSNATQRPLPPYRGDLKCEVAAREF